MLMFEQVGFGARFEIAFVFIEFEDTVDTDDIIFAGYGFEGFNKVIGDQGAETLDGE